MILQVRFTELVGLRSAILSEVSIGKTKAEVKRNKEI
jgi:hypothetical protein